MHTRASGKALGRRIFCLRNRLPAVPWVAAASWLVCTGISAEREARADALPAFHEIEQVTVRKQRFFDYLTPVVRAENERIRRQRERLLRIAVHWEKHGGHAVSGLVAELVHTYRIDHRGLSADALMNELLIRVDVIPLSLVLAQAAKESAWGSSRFARQANNLFGQWCFETGCGVVPRRRPAGMTHEVRSFDTVRESVASYMRNLNTHESYEALRELRARLRAANRPLSGMLLAEGLTLYSARGDSYVREVQTMIRQNGLEAERVAPVMAGS